MDGCWEMENLLSAGIRLLRGCPCTNIHVHTGSPKCCGFKRKKKEYMELGEKKAEGKGEIEEEGWSEFD